jgi:hypothetical protein
MVNFFRSPVSDLGYNLLLVIYNYCTVFSEEYKYTIGKKLKDETTTMFLNIHQASKSKQEGQGVCINSARRNIEAIRSLVCDCRDLKIIGNKGFVVIIVQVEELSKQLADW